MLFDSEAGGHHVIMDAPGEQGAGMPPKKLMLSALAGCTGMDVLAMLRKMRIDLTGFRLHVEAELTDDLPKHYHRMHVVYEFSGQDLPMDKLEKACLVSTSLWADIVVGFEIYSLHLLQSVDGYEKN